MITFRMINQNPRYDYLEACKITQGIDLDGDYSKLREMTDYDEVKYWVNQIIANHSTLRYVRFVMKGKAPKSVVMQLIRATKGNPQPEVQSSRPDWNNGKERSSNPYEEILFCQLHTAESFIEMAKQRLCVRTEKRTRDYMNYVVKSMRESQIPFLVAVGICSKSKCDITGKCNEMHSCGKHKRIDYTDLVSSILG